MVLLTSITRSTRKSTEVSRERIPVATISALALPETSSIPVTKRKRTLRPSEVSSIRDTLSPRTWAMMVEDVMRQQPTEVPMMRWMPALPASLTPATLRIRIRTRVRT